jgi:thiol-disulfide isomerase/thioredoxin
MKESSKVLSSNNSVKKGSFLGANLLIGTLLLASLGALWVWMYLRKMERFDSMSVITYYYLPTCGWCDKFTPIWDEFEKEAKSKNLSVIIKKIDGNTASEETDKYNIRGFPHVQLVKGETVVVFNDERNVANLMTFVQNNA